MLFKKKTKSFSEDNSKFFEVLERENAYIEGLLVSLFAVKEISPELSVDLFSDFRFALNESRGLYSRIALNIENSSATYNTISVSVDTDTDTAQYIPIFTSDKYQKEFSDDSKTVSLGEEAHPTILTFKQLTDFVMDAKKENPVLKGVIINPSNERQNIILSLLDMQNIVNEYGEAQKDLSEEESVNRRIIWLIDDEDE